MPAPSLSTEDHWLTQTGVAQRQEASSAVPMLLAAAPHRLKTIDATDYA